MVFGLFLTYYQIPMKIYLLTFFLFCSIIGVNAQIDSENRSIAIPAENVDDPLEDDEIIIQQNGEKKYKLILDDSTRVNAFSKKIKGFNIMNITEEHNGVFTNIFYGFEITNDTLVVSEVTDKLRKEDFGSQAELLNFFNENIEKEDFFLNPEIMIKK